MTLVDETRAGAAMFRDNSREAPHNLFGQARGSSSGSEARRSRRRRSSRTAARTRRPPGTRVTKIGVGFGNGYAVSYAWNKKHKSWDRSIFGNRDLVASGKQESPRNVVVMFVNYAGGAGVIGAEAELVGEGDMVVFTDGHRITGRWVRPDRAQPVRASRRCRAPSCGSLPARPGSSSPPSAHPSPATDPGFRRRPDAGRR